MVSGKYSAVAGAVAREQSIANLAANLANVNTTGYKRTSVSFESLLRGEKQVTDAKGINYSRVRQNVSDLEQGGIRETGNPFDMAINGPGFFKVQGPQGILYTRRGDFVVDAESTLRTTNGMAVLDDANAEITVPDTDIGTIVVSEDGTISLVTPEGDNTEAARLAIVDIDGGNLQRESDTTFSLINNGAELPVEIPQVIQGSLEVSNVNMIAEMTKMIDSYRTFETYHKVLESYSTLGQQQDELGTIG